MNVEEDARQVPLLRRSAAGPTVETESVYYDLYTSRYNSACARAAQCAHVLVVSSPFRMPWLTSDFPRNARPISCSVMDACP